MTPWWALIVVMVGAWLLMIHAEWRWQRWADRERAVWRRVAEDHDAQLERDIR